MPAQARQIGRGSVRLVRPGSTPSCPQIRQMQAIGIAAAPMNRRPELLSDPQLTARGLYQPMTHPLLEGVLPAESGPAPFRRIGRVRTLPAPLAGQHTREICRDVLGFDTAETDRLLAE